MEKNVRKLTLDGREYTMRVMPPSKAIYFAPKVATAIGGVIGGAVGKFKGDNEELGTAIGKAVSGLDPDKFTELSKEALAYECYFGKNRLSSATFFDEHFSEYPEDLFPVAVWAIWEHSKGFFMKSLSGFQTIFTGTV